MAISILHVAHLVAVLCTQRIPLLQTHTRDRQEGERPQEALGQKLQSAQSRSQE